MESAALSDRTDALTAARSLRAVIESHAETTERDGTMPPAVVEAIRATGLFSLLVPRELGGSGSDLSTFVEVVEELSRSDASTGWSYMANAATAAILSARLGDSAVAEVFARPETAITAGMLAPIGKGETVDDGVRVSGDFAFASGSGHATWIAGGFPLTTESGTETIVFVVPRDRVEFLGNWDVLGLVGTGSFDYRMADDCFVPRDYTFSRTGKALRGQASIRLAPDVVGIAGHAGVALGSAWRALEEIARISETARARPGMPPMREQQLFLHTFGVLDAKYRSTRSYVLETVAAVVAEQELEGEASEVSTDRYRQASTLALETAAEIVSTCYTWSGSVGLRNPHPLGRYMRDILAQTQHAQMDTNTFTKVAPNLLRTYLTTS